MTKNVYIHIPFCKSKCKYCSFISYPKVELKNEYLKALHKEIQNGYKGELLATLYFGGGTPSLLSPDEFKRLIKLFITDKQTEITAELNPENITEQYLRELKFAGINRISFGCQTFNNDILKAIGRRHNANDVKNAVKIGQRVGFDNINLDFIYGLPEQTIEMFEQDIKLAAELRIQHISLYGLKIDKDCYFGKFPPKDLPDDDIQADMYLKAIELTQNYGFEHYEISNFAIKNFESKHNLNYWNNNTYYGFGVSAHGYENNCRYSNTINLEEYIKNPTKHKIIHNLSTQEQIEEEIFLGFRKAEGISTQKFKEKFNINFENNYKSILDKYNDFIEKTPVGYKLNNKGFLISNTILADFLN